jgi:hypothetical protein
MTEKIEMNVRAYVLTPPSGEHSTQRYPIRSVRILYRWVRIGTFFKMDYFKLTLYRSYVFDWLM